MRSLAQGLRVAQGSVTSYTSFLAEAQPPDSGRKASDSVLVGYSARTYNALMLALGSGDGLIRAQGEGRTARAVRVPP